MQQLSDEELVAKLRINELFQRYHTRVAAWCFRFTGDRDAAVDLAQETFLKAYRNLGSFRGDAKFSTWLFSIARNHCVNEMKARSARPEYATDAADLDMNESNEANVLEALEREESVETLRTLINEALDETEKQVLSLHYAEEIELDAISRLLGLTNTSGAKAYIVSAKRKLGAAAQRLKAREQRKIK
jgi:RNA polymerase sigma-70 factor (ECF subfamily)